MKTLNAGFQFENCSLKKLNKDRFVLSEGLLAQISRDELKAQMQEVLKNNGLVYFVTRKKEVCGIAIIAFEKHMAEEFIENEKTSVGESNEPETKAEANDKEKMNIEAKVMDKALEIEEKTLTKREQEKAKLANAYVLKDFYLDDSLKEKEKEISEALIQELKEKAAYNNLCVKVLIWQDDIIIDKTIGKVGASAITLGMSIGMCIGMAIGALARSNHGNSSYMVLGMCFGMSIGISLGTAYYAYQSEKGKEI